MPEWLIKDENYTPETDKDTFINRSILSILGILSKMKTQSEYKEDKYRLSTVLKVAFTLMLVILVSISRNYTFIITIIIYLLSVLSLMDAVRIIRVLRISLVMAVFTFIILLPTVFWGNNYSIIMITSKVFATVTAVNILSNSTRWSLVTSALKRFFIPGIFILVLDITIKYIVMLGDFSLGMLYALKLRSVGRNKSKYASLSGIAGTMFIKSKEMAEDMYQAMECRGFTGEYRIYDKIKLGIADVLYIVFNVGILAVFLYLERV